MVRIKDLHVLVGEAAILTFDGKLFPDGREEVVLQKVNGVEIYPFGAKSAQQDAARVGVTVAGWDYAQHSARQLMRSRYGRVNKTVKAPVSSDGKITLEPVLTIRSACA